jgi:hypothetical protein
VHQDYRPPEVAGRVYYVPSDHGEEGKVRQRLEAFWARGGDLHEAEQGPRSDQDSDDPPA